MSDNRPNSDNLDIATAELDKIVASIDELQRMSEADSANFHSEDFFKLFASINKSLDDFGEKSLPVYEDIKDSGSEDSKDADLEQQYQSLYSQYQDCIFTANRMYEVGTLKNNRITNLKIESVEQKLDKSQGVQLTVFSIVLTILAFVLTNSKFLAADNISFRNVILVNLSYLLVTCVLFSLVYCFLNIPLKIDKFIKSKVIFISTVIIMLIAAIVVVAIFVK